MNNFVFIKTDGKFTKLNFSDILYIEALNNYVSIVTSKKKYMILVTMKHVEKFLPINQFCRIHRSYIVSLHSIQEFDNCMVYMQQKTLPIGKEYKMALHDRVTTLNYESGNDLISSELTNHINFSGLS